jgi:hypothetical protein
MSLKPEQDFPLVGFDDARARSEVLEGNRIRQAAKLPALAVDQELQRMKAAYDQNRFEEFMRSPLKEVVEQKLLARMRRRGGNPEQGASQLLSFSHYTPRPPQAVAE